MKNNQNILMVAYTHYSSDARVQKEATALVESGWKVDFIALHENNETRAKLSDGVKLFYVYLGKYRGISNMRYLVSYLIFFILVMSFGTYLYFKNHYALIHVNNMPDFLVFAFIIPKLCGAKLILDIHDSMPLLYSNKFEKADKSLLERALVLQERLSANFVDKVLTVHELLKSEVLVVDGISPTKIEIILNYADDKYFRHSEHYYVDGCLRILYHGTIAERFGFDYVLQELAKARDENILLTIIGEGDYSAKLKELIIQYRLEDKVVFENRNYPIHELSSIIEKHNLGLVTYKISRVTEYMLPVKIFEYLNVGIPILSARNKVIKHYFEEDDVLYYDPRVTGSLSKMLIKITRDKNILYVQRNKSIQLIKKYMWNEQSIKYCKIVSQLIEG